MWKLLRLLLPALVMLALVSQCNKEVPEPEPEPEPEPPEHFEIVDGSFLNALIALGYDQNEDSAIDSLEALDIEFLYIDSCNISDLEGIRNMVNLKYMDCSHNHISKLDVSYNIQIFPQKIVPFEKTSSIDSAPKFLNLIFGRLTLFTHATVKSNPVGLCKFSFEERFEP